MAEAQLCRSEGWFGDQARCSSGEGQARASQRHARAGSARGSAPRVFVAAGLLERERLAGFVEAAVRPTSILPFERGCFFGAGFSPLPFPRGSSAWRSRRRSAALTGAPPSD